MAIANTIAKLSRPKVADNASDPGPYRPPSPGSTPGPNATQDPDAWMKPPDLVPLPKEMGPPPGFLRRPEGTQPDFYAPQQEIMPWPYTYPLPKPPESYRVAEGPTFRDLPSGSPSTFSDLLPAGQSSPATFSDLLPAGQPGPGFNVVNGAAMDDTSASGMPPMAGFNPPTIPALDNAASSGMPPMAGFRGTPPIPAANQAWMQHLFGGN